jgi:hypothetical protein
VRTSSHFDGALLAEQDKSHLVDLELSGESSSDPYQRLIYLLKHHSWKDKPKAVEVLKPILTRLCYNYIVEEKHGIHAHDRVANFHFRNGASLAQINWLADISSKGLSQSASLMVGSFFVFHSKPGVCH